MFSSWLVKAALPVVLSVSTLGLVYAPAAQAQMTTDPNNPTDPYSPPDMPTPPDPGPADPTPPDSGPTDPAPTDPEPTNPAPTHDVTPGSAPQEGAGRDKQASPAAEPSAGATTPQQAGVAFAKELLCASACTASVNKSGDVTVEMTTTMPAGNEITTTIAEKGTTVSTVISTDDKPLAQATKTFETEEQTKAAVADLTKSMNVTYGGWATTSATMGVDAMREAVQREVERQYGKLSFEL